MILVYARGNVEILVYACGNVEILVYARGNVDPSERIFSSGKKGELTFRQSKMAANELGSTR